jgi:hypothetical protein
MSMIEGIDNTIVPALLSFIEERVPPESSEKFRTLRQLADLTRPSDWHIATRAMER